MDEIINVISTLGFPVFVAVALFYFAIKFIETQIAQYAEREVKLIEAYKTNEERYSAQLDKFTESLNNFNITLTKIDSRLEALEKAVNKGE